MRTDGGRSWSEKALGFAGTFLIVSVMVRWAWNTVSPVLPYLGVAALIAAILLFIIRGPRSGEGWPFLR